MNASATETGVQQPTLEQLDGWCEQALSAPDSETRTEAERRLRYFFPTFSETLAEAEGSYGVSSGHERVMAVFPQIKGAADAAQLMTWFLHQTTKVFSLTYIVRRLRTLVLNHLGVLTDEQKSELRAGLFATIQEKAADMPAFVVDDMARTLALVVMFTWFDQPEAREVVEAVVSSTTAGQHATLGLQVLRAFVEQFNRELPARYIARQRRVVVAFRDRQLRSVFEAGLAAMRRGLAAGDAGREELSRALRLQSECLGFDFIGLAPDEASDDAVAIQVPSAWKDTLQTEDFLDPYFDGYARCGPPVSSQFVEVLVLLASVRRSFYAETARTAFVRRMARGIAEILRGAVGLEDVENYHHVCRLLSRFRSIHTLVEIEEAPEYRELLAATAQFTATGLGLWEWSPNSTAPLLAFWAKVAATHDTRDDSNTQVAGDVISQTLPRVIGDYLRAMVMATARAQAGDLADSPLADTDALLETMASVASIARSAYERCAPVILQLLRDMASEYEAQTGAVGALEERLAWPIYAVALCVGARQPYRSQPEDDRSDADMFATALELDRLVQQRSQSPPSEAFEMAFLQLLVSFRASYVGEQGSRVSGVFTRLAELVGLADAAAVLDLIVQRLLLNLRRWPAPSPVVRRSLQMFHDLTAGYVAVRQAAALDSSSLLLANHASEHFHFLRHVDEYKLRALYYAGLARLLFADSARVPARFAEFVAPWSQLADALLPAPDEQLVQDAVRPRLLRLLRDVRGFLTAIASRPNYLRVFDWLCPARMPLVQRCVRMSVDVHVQIAALKLLAELVYNRTQRLNFDVSSPNGILLFRDASEAICAYGTAVLSSDAAVRDVYKDRYKGVAVCFTILTRLLAGKYVAIGVMPLYGDPALERAYAMVLDLLLRFPVADVIAYPKLGRATMTMLEALLGRPNVDLVNLSESAYAQIMRLCVEAFDHAETAVSSAACSVVDSLLSAAIEDSDRPAALPALVRGRPDVSRFLLSTILNIVLFEDRPNDWSFSRPLFCLIALEHDFALQYSAQIVQYQPPERRDALVAALKDLFSATPFELTSANRDAFTQALSQYRRCATANNLILMVPTTQTLGAPVDILKQDDASAAAAQDEGEAAMAE
ncbi:hypothetical protein H4R20_002606 [Coemansia guatemalensis]|uniref:Exportin-7/Ran-binding protein 17 TPR repeats domain-containing protein n=1 Tax=Coemansia guatemalensis TaxID=2761395 RepID=A0A9W8I3H7_9FUNG|nr:hypothetical protein H4R20_002606 [Coemansia guatemalensis]